MGLLVELGIFLSVALVVLAVAWMLAPREDAVKKRLRDLRLGDAPVPPSAAAEAPAGSFLQNLLERLGGAPAADPEENVRKAISDDPRSVRNFLLLKLALMVALPSIYAAACVLAGVADPTWLVMGCLLLAPTGMFLPNAIKANRDNARRDALRRSLPDVLDLLVICVEAGMSLNAAFKRVAEKIESAAPALSAEFMKLHLEIQAGRSREDALRAMGDRTGVDEIRSLTAMMIQTEKLGTSISKALRVHSEAIRSKFHHEAEATAARATVKLAFPLILCIFPALLVVIVGPAAIKIWTAFSALE